MSDNPRRDFTVLRIYHSVAKTESLYIFSREPQRRSKLEEYDYGIFFYAAETLFEIFLHAFLVL